MRAAIFCNGEVPQISSVRGLIQTDDVVVSVDGGMRYVDALKLIPNIIIGDMDSVRPELLSTAENHGAEVLRFPPAKDETDLELTFNMLKNRGFTECLVIGGLGGRIDQTLANIWLLAENHSKDFRIFFDDGCERLEMILDDLLIEGNQGDTVSLIPYSTVVNGISTQGLEYPLRDEPLYPQQTRGLSNVMLGKQAHIQIGSGRLLCVVRRQSIS